HRCNVLRSDNPGAKKFRKVIFLGVDIVPKLKISRIDSPVVQIGNVAHGRNCQSQVKAGEIRGGSTALGGCQTSQTITPAGTIVVLRVEAFFLCILKKSDHAQSLCTGFVSFNPGGRVIEWLIKSLQVRAVICEVGPAKLVELSVFNMV